MLQSLIAEAPPRSRIVVVGVCMHTDVIEPFMAVTKEIELRFSFGYTPDRVRRHAGTGWTPGSRGPSCWSPPPSTWTVPGAFATLRTPASTARSW